MSSTSETLTAPNIRREMLTIGAVGTAHFGSHAMQIAIAPLLPLIVADLGASFVELGLVMALFYAVSGLGQVAAGMLVDRLGAHRLLIAGVFLQAVSVAAMALVPNHYWLFPLAVTAGLGNTVYHPADLSILSRRVDPSRLGRAFASHTAAGSIGFALWPVVVGLIAASFGWRVPLMATGLFGLLVGVVLIANLSRIETTASHEARSDAAPLPFLKVLMIPAVGAGFAFFMLSTLATEATRSFGVSTLVTGFSFDLGLAALLVTITQLSFTGGVVIGGFLVDRTSRNDLVGLVSIGGAVFFLVLASLFGKGVLLFPLLALVGLFAGVGNANRDVLVRMASPPNAIGKVFGTVYAGLDAGGVLAPLIYAPMLDHGLASAVYLVAAGMLALSSVPLLILAARKYTLVGR